MAIPNPTTTDVSPSIVASDHPVLSLIAARQRDGSLPGARSDNARLALVIEGGGMRGVVSGGMVTGLQLLNIKPVFDVVYGTSAGALAGAYYLADQASLGTSIYYEDLVHGDFVNYRRWITRRGPLVSLEFLLDEVMELRKPLDYERILGSGIPLRIVATRVADYKPHVLGHFTDASSIREALRASARIPVASGTPVEVEGDEYLDGSVTQSIPLSAALADKVTHVVALLTRPHGQLRGTSRRWERHLLYPFMNRHLSGLGDAHLPRAANYAAEVAHLLELSRNGQQPPHALAVHRPLDAIRVRQLEQSSAVLVQGAAEGAAAVYRTLCGQVPRFFQALQPI